MWLLVGFHWREEKDAHGELAYCYTTKGIRRVGAFPNKTPESSIVSKAMLAFGIWAWGTLGANVDFKILIHKKTNRGGVGICHAQEYGLLAKLQYMLKVLSGLLIMAALSISGRTFSCPVGLFEAFLLAPCTEMKISLLCRKGSL